MDDQPLRPGAEIGAFRGQLDRERTPSIVSLDAQKGDCHFRTSGTTNPSSVSIDGKRGDQDSRASGLSPVKEILVRHLATAQHSLQLAQEVVLANPQPESFAEKKLFLESRSDDCLPRLGGAQDGAMDDFHINSDSSFQVNELGPDLRTTAFPDCSTQIYELEPPSDPPPLICVSSQATTVSGRSQLPGMMPDGSPRGLGSALQWNESKISSLRRPTGSHESGNGSLTGSKFTALTETRSPPARRGGHSWASMNTNSESDDFNRAPSLCSSRPRVRRARDFPTERISKDSSSQSFLSLESFEVLPVWNGLRIHDRNQARASMNSPAYRRAITASAGMNKALQQDVTEHVESDGSGSAPGNDDTDASKSTHRPPVLKKAYTVTFKEALSYGVWQGGWHSRQSIERVIIHPLAIRRAIWDAFSLAFVVYDMISIPLALFEQPLQTFEIVMVWITRLFWTVDLVASFLTGYAEKDGSIEMCPSKISRRYLRSWFALDFFMVLIDWSETIWASEAFGLARAGKASRALRIVRTIRLLRVIRMKEIYAMVTERIQSERLVILGDVAKIILTMFCLAHFLACAWYGISNCDGCNGWITVHGYSDASMGDSYAMSLHWALSQFAGGMDEITPESSVERVYAILVYMFSFMVAAMFISSLTSSMTQLAMLGHQQAQQLQVLRRYLAENGISNQLAMRVQRNAQHRLAEQQRCTPEENVELLQLVSEPLRADLHFEAYAKLLHSHSFFNRYIQECPQVMRKVCHHAITTLPVSAGDIIFALHEIPFPPQMYVVWWGSLRYISKEGLEVECKPGRCLAEGSLWTTWVHRGTLIAESHCRLVLVHAQKFQEISTSFVHTPEVNPRGYARDYVHRLNRSFDMTDVTPVPGDRDLEYVSRDSSRSDGDPFEQAKPFQLVKSHLPFWHSR